MSDDGGDSGGIVGEIVDTLGDVAGAAADELKKFGQSATSQISGHPSQAAQPTKGDISKVKSAVSGGSAGDETAISEIKDFGKTFLGQITGQVAPSDSSSITKMAKEDKKFSEVESAKVKAKISQIYQEYAAKRDREEQQKEMLQKQQEEQTKQIEEQKKKQEIDATNPAIAKTRAEIKNYGAE